LSSARVAAAARRWLDLDASPQSIDNALAALPGAPGLRLPGSLDPFELAVRAVLGQQVTVAAARTLAHRFVARFGDAAATPWDDVTRSFPAPQVLADTAVAQIAELGIIRTRAAAIIALSQAWSRLSEHFGSGHLGGTHTGGHAAPEALITQLRELPGIGPWTAHYIAMRALSWPDAFPPQDVAVLKAMKQLWGTASQRDADSQAQAWQPWRAYAVLKLWNSLEKPA
jgi:AraC family transcriptional regulator of adaptative response / DNA-3-methyladenine glycosylase II